MVPQLGQYIAPRGAIFGDIAPGNENQTPITIGTNQGFLKQFLARSPWWQESCFTIGAMTIRINVDHHHNGTTTISLHGWIESEEEAFELLSVARESSAPVVLDLQELHNLDANGLAALTALSAEGARLARTSDFIKLLLKSHKDPRPSSKPGSKGEIE